MRGAPAVVRGAQPAERGLGKLCSFGWRKPTTRHNAHPAPHPPHPPHAAKMVPFAGWSMPIQYTDSIMDSTHHCRSSASLFDVAHMCGLSLRGRDAVSFLETLVVGDVAAMAPGTGGLTVFTNEKGGIIDDSVVTRVAENDVYLVVNAGCAEKDLAHIGKHLATVQAAGKDVQMTVHTDRALLALQGPKAADVLGALAPALPLTTFYFSHFAKADVAGVPDVWITRTGYTGEDGFELSIPAAAAPAVAAAALAAHGGGVTRWAGLGARDALRLEAGLCLYGNDLTEDITPVEAGLTWTIGKRRRSDCAFLGGATIAKQLADGVSVRRVGLVAPKGAPPPPTRRHPGLDGQACGGGLVGRVFAVPQDQRGDGLRPQRARQGGHPAQGVGAGAGVGGGGDQDAVCAQPVLQGAMRREDGWWCGGKESVLRERERHEDDSFFRLV